MEPKIPKQLTKWKTCNSCGESYPEEEFCYTHSIFYGDHRIPVCNKCINKYLEKNNFEWVTIDKVCQWADIPWVVREWERLAELNGVEKTWPVYSKIFAAREYENLGWADYNKQYLKLKETGYIEEEIPGMRERKLADLQRKWGPNYSPDELYYLEDLYKGLLTSQNVNGALQVDQAQKICKLSLEVDSRIRAGDKDVDKFLSAYDKLVKTAEFTPKNTKNAVDFDSFAEVAYWLEKRGRENHFYDGATRDVIDETLKNIETYNQRLYINEGGIGQAITERLDALKNANALEQETFYDIQPEFSEDEYDNAGFIVDEDFSTDVKDLGV